MANFLFLGNSAYNEDTIAGISLVSPSRPFIYKIVFMDGSFITTNDESEYETIDRFLKLKKQENGHTS